MTKDIIDTNKHSNDAHSDELDRLFDAADGQLAEQRKAEKAARKKAAFQDVDRISEEAFQTADHQEPDTAVRQVYEIGRANPDLMPKGNPDVFR